MAKNQKSEGTVLLSTFKFKECRVPYFFLIFDLLAEIWPFSENGQVGSKIYFIVKLVSKVKLLAGTFAKILDHG